MKLLTCFECGVVRKPRGVITGLTFLILSLTQAQSVAFATSGSVAAGANVTFMAAADGYPAPSFQWRKNGVVVPGATATSFTLNGVSSSDAATYQVVATN